MIGQLLTGRYLILENLGAGGFSETYLARDKFLPDYPLCVVKCLKPSSDNPIPIETAERLFEIEAFLLERLGRQHRQIPTLLAYCHEHDSVYLVQEYIEGENLAAWLAEEVRLNAEGAIALLLELLPVLDFVHSFGVVHRDITPGNLIRRRSDGKLVLIDFGAACILSNAEAHPASSDSPLAIGTPGYMPDEQQAGMTCFSSDLYALGILTIHLMTGVEPQQFQKNPISGELDWHRHLPEGAMQAGVSPNGLDPAFAEILDRLVRINVRDRYQKAAEVLADLQALPTVKSFQRQQSQPLWQRKARRFALPFAAALLLGVVGKPFVPMLTVQAQRLLEQVTPPFHLSDSHLSKIADLSNPAAVQRIAIAPDSRTLVTAEADRVLRVWSLPEGNLLRSLSGHQTSITALAISRDNQRLVAGSEDGTVYLWDMASGKRLQALKGHSQSVTTVAISPDARTFATGAKDGRIHQWEMVSGKRLRTVKLPNTEVAAVVYGAAPESLISASSDRQLQVWNLRTGERQRSFVGHTDAIVGLQVVDDRWLFSFGQAHSMVWDLKQEALVRVFPKKAENLVTASLCDQHIVTVHNNGSIRIWTYRTGKLVATETNRLGTNVSIALSPDHRYIVSWSAEQPLQLWQLQVSKI